MTLVTQICISTIFFLPVFCGNESQVLVLGFSIGLLNFFYSLIEKNKIPVKTPVSILASLIFLFFLLTTQLYFSRGFVILGGGGYVVLFSFIYYHIIKIENIKNSLLIQKIAVIYRIAGLLLLCEVVLIFFGFQEEIKNFIPTYKTYVSSDLIKFVPGFQNTGGANSVLLGSQSAGMLSVLGFIWESCIWMRNPNKQKIIYIFWLCVFFLCFLLTLGGTSTILFFAYLVLFPFFLKNKKLLAINISFILISITLISAFDMFERMNQVDKKLYNFYLANSLNPNPNISGFNLILYAFFGIFFVWLQSSLFDKIIGFGKNKYLDIRDIVFSDCSFLTDILFKSGIIWTFIFLAFILFPIWKSSKINNDYNNCSKIFSACNKCCVITLFLSLCHYGQAIQNPGFVLLFGLHHAALFCQK